MSRYDRQKVKKLLQFILACAGQNDDYFSRSLSSIHLIKYVYLADLEYAKHHGGETYTGLPWRFYKFGPYCEEILSEIEPALTEIGAEQTTTQHPKYEDDFIKWHFRDDEFCEQLDDELHIAVSGIVQRAVQEFAADTTSLLNHVYNTVPMLTAAPNENLDFNKAAEIKQKGQEASRISGISPKEELTDRQKKKRKELIADFKEKMHEKEKNRKKKVAPTPPRYDEVFEESLSWLDSLDGEPLKPAKGKLIVSPEVWKSKSRFDPENIDGDLS